MATVIRAEISESNKYWISKHRHYELKHFCLQYPTWKKAYLAFDESRVPSSIKEHVSTSNVPGDPTGTCVVMKTFYAERMDLIERTAKNADPCLYDYILKAVTEGLSYTYLKSKLNIPCGRDMYYDRYRKFFWLLNQARN